MAASGKVASEAKTGTFSWPVRVCESIKRRDLLEKCFSIKPAPKAPNTCFSGMDTHVFLEVRPLLGVLEQPATGRKKEKKLRF